MDIKKLLSLTGKTIGDNSPWILAGLGVSGLISTSYLTARAMIPAIRDVNQAKSEFIEITPKEAFLLTWRYFIPPMIVGSATMACIIGATTVSHRRQAALISAYALTEKGFAEYREQVKTTLSEKKAIDVQDSIAERHVKENPPPSSEVLVVSTGDVLCYDDLSGRYFTSNVETIRRAMNDVNAQCINEVYASLNDFYSRIGLSRTAMGEEVGWSTDRMLDIHFTTTMTEDGRPAICLNYRQGPIRGYYKGF